MNSLETAKKALEDTGSTCAVLSDTLHLYTDRGILPLFSALDDGFLKDAYVADKVIGKSAAMLLCKGGIRALYAKVISRPACALLDAQGIPYTFSTVCDYIINRRGDGMCPMEATVLDVSDVETGVAALREKLQQMQ